MSQASPARRAESGREPDFIPPQLELAALRDHPSFPAAMRVAAANSVRLHGGGRMIGWLMSDRTLIMLTPAVVSLDADVRDDDPRSGLTPGRLKAFCVQRGLCSERRAAALLAYMRLSGHLMAETHPADRRITRLKPTEKLLETMRSRLRAQLEGVAMVWPEIGGAVDRLESPDFVREMGLAFLRRFTSGPRLIDQAPELRLFLERDEGALILYALMLGADPAEPLPPATAVPLSIKALARQFRVSRTHVLRLVRDAEASGLLSRVGAKGEQVVFAPRLQEGLRKLFATMFQQSAVSVWTAMNTNQK